MLSDQIRQVADAIARRMGDGMVTADEVDGWIRELGEIADSFDARIGRLESSLRRIGMVLGDVCDELPDRTFVVSTGRQQVEPPL